MDQPVNFSGVMPSAEASFFDTAQLHTNNQGSGINFPFPNPASGMDHWNESGLLKTYGPDTRPEQEHQSGIFNYNNLISLFHNTGTVPAETDFDIFNPLIHHTPLIKKVGRTEKEVGPFEVPYVSDYIISTPFFPYPF